nr:MAG TPA: hypothetical protein [Caudoviricetes sp.]
MGIRMLNTISSQFRRSHSQNRRILSPPNMVNLTGRETGGTMGKRKNQKKTIRTTRVCAPASPGSTGAFASMPLLLAMCAIRERVRLPRHTMGGHSRGPVRPGDDISINP